MTNASTTSLGAPKFASVQTCKDLADLVKRSKLELVPSHVKQDILDLVRQYNGVLAAGTETCQRGASEARALLEFWNTSKAGEAEVDDVYKLKTFASRTHNGSVAAQESVREFYRELEPIRSQIQKEMSSLVNERKVKSSQAKRLGAVGTLLTATLIGAPLGIAMGAKAIHTATRANAREQDRASLQAMLEILTKLRQEVGPLIKWWQEIIDAVSQVQSSSALDYITEGNLMQLRAILPQIVEGFQNYVAVIGQAPDTLRDHV